MSDPQFLAGKMLLALPGMGDPRFERAVIMVCAHDEDGALGVGIGHVRAGLTFRGLMKQLGLDPGQAPAAPVLHGGPVEPGRGFILHSVDWGGQDTVDIAGQMKLTGTIDVLKAIAEGRGPSRWIAALGYAGWGAGQLDEEMHHHGWLAAPSSDRLLYETAPVNRWDEAFNSMGVDPRLLSTETGAA